jgi:hypothetical protein
MKQVIYTPENPPTKGVAKKIWNTLIANGFSVDELHYNKGPKSNCGSGTWACEAHKEGVGSCIDNEFGYWCGILGKTGVYIMQTSAPYGEYFVGFTTRECPFRCKSGCKYPSMNPNFKNIWPENCPRECNAGNDEFLLLRNNEYEKWRK